MDKKRCNERGQTLEEFLDAYDPARYERPSVTVDMVVLTVHENRLSVVLIKRGDHPNIGKWALPGGFINLDETLVQSAARELSEETGLTGVSLHPIGCFGEPSRDPRTRIVTAAFVAYAPFNALKIAAGDDAAEAKLFCVRLEKRGPIKIEPQMKRNHDVTLPCTACGEGFDALGEEVALELQCGSIQIVARLAVAPSADGLDQTAVLLSRNEDEKSNALAGDHALILFSALRDLGRKNTVKAARLMEAEPYVLECALSMLR